MSGTKGIRSIQEAVKDHADATVRVVGKKPPTSIGRWIANVTAVAIVSTIALASGAVISGQAEAQTYKGGMMKPLQQIQFPSLDVGGYNARPQPMPAEEAPLPSVDLPELDQDFVDVALEVLRHNGGMSTEEAVEVLNEMMDAAAFALEHHKQPGRLVFNSHGVTLNFNDLANPVHTAFYSKQPKNGSPPREGKHGAIQKGNTVEIFNGNDHFIIPGKAP